MPWINNKEQAERAGKYGLETNKYISTADEEIFLIAQIETEEALKNIDEIMKVKGG